MNVKASVLRRLSGRFIAFCLVGVFPFSLQSQPQQSPQTLHRHVPSVVANGQASLVGKLSPSKQMRLTVVLPLRNQSALTSLLKELYDPANPNYRHFLTVQQFTDQFGPTIQDYQSVISYFQKNGFTVRDTSKNRLVIDVSGTVAQVNAAFGVSMNVYRDPNGKRTFFSSDREPTLNLAVPIKHIEGLNDFSVPQPMVRKKKNASPIADVTGSGPGGYYLGSDMRAAYYGGTLLTGAGQSVGLLEFGGYRLSDVDLTFNNAGQSYSVPINNVLLDGASAAAGSDDTEEVLDIAQAIGMAPGLSQVRVYIGTSDTDIFNKMADENICKELSVSWSWAPDDPTTDDGIFQELAAQGQSIFVASGDNGAYDPSVSPYFYPAEDAYVTTVGGTHLTTNYGGGPWLSESAWNTDGNGSGGGVSPDSIPIPSWQQGVATWPNGGSSSLRNAPDVAMEGDTDNYYCDLGFCSGGEGGTSFAAPRWAGFMALVNQQAVEAGTAPSGGLGFINPAVYSLGESPNFSTDFHDVTDGNNDTANQIAWYSAVAGYDLVTGWGSPNGQNLIDALAGTAVPGFWLATTPSALSVYQGDSGTTIVSVTDAGGFTGNVNLTASGLPTGVTAAFNPTSTPGTSQLILTADSSATVGTATVMISGVSGTLTASTQVALTINPPQTAPPPVKEFGSVNVGATSSTTTLTLTITTAATLSNIGVLTQGSPNLDFTNASGGTCATGKRYKAGTTCTVNVVFSPKYPGTRDGAVVLTDKNGNPLASSIYLQGIGIGPQSTFTSGVETTVGTGFLSPEGVAIRGDGSIYAADYGNSTTHGALYLETFANGTYTQAQLSCTFNKPVGVAVDGSGAIYVTDPGASAVYKVTISGSNCTQTAIGSGFSQPWGVAVDASGNLYIAAKSNQAVYKETLQSNGTYIQTTIGSGWIAPVGVAVDGSGNVYVADSGIPGVFKESPSGGNYTQSLIGQGWTAPSGIAVDNTAGVYVSDAGNTSYEGGLVPAGVYKEVVSSTNYIQTQIGSGWISPNGLAVNATGDVVVADAARGVYKEDLADPPQLSYGNAESGALSSDSPKIVTVSNLGTSALNFSAVSYPADFSESPSGSTDCTTSTTLSPGQTCTLSIDFLPTTVLGGETSLLLSESVTISTNTLNTAATQQTITASGTEVLPEGSVNLDVSANPSTAGNSVTFTATVAGRTGGPTPTGTVTFYSGSTPLSGAISLINGGAAYSTASLSTGTYTISASYSGDSNYAGLSSNAITENILAAAGTAPISNTNIGNVNVGSTSGPIPLTITFAQAETLGGIAVLTQGAPNLDFTNGGGGTCTIGTAYGANATCTVDVMFSPKYSGMRYGAVVLSDNNGNLIGTGYLEGTGTGAQISFSPGTVTALPTSCYPCSYLEFSYPQGIAVDSNGNLYVADFGAATVYKEPNFAWFSQAVTIGSGFSKPSGVAVDAAGNVFIADPGTHAVYKETLSNGSYLQTTLGYGFNSPTAVAVDGLGNVYVADFGTGVTGGAVYLETLSNGSYAQTKIAGTFATPQAIAVDANENIFVADSANGDGTAAVYKLTPSGGAYNQSSIGYGWITPTGVAVDGNGNVFVTDDNYDLGSGFVAEESLLPAGGYTQSIVSDPAAMLSECTKARGPSCIVAPGGIALDGNGNRYTTDDFMGLVYRQDVSDPPSSSFTATQYDEPSSDSPKTIAVENVGNAALTFSSVNFPADFPEVPGIPTDCTVQSSLQSRSSCTLSINFDPGTPLSSGQSQSLAENVTITTNALGASTQNLAVSGTEIAPAATVVLSAPANVYAAGATVTFTATVTGQSGLAAPTGTVTFYSVLYNGNTALSTSPLGSDGTATYSTSSLAAAVYSIIATYSGDQVYGSATSSTIIVNIIPNSTFGTENIGTAKSVPVTVTFSSNTTLGGIAVLTDGMPNLDFTNAGGGTCSIGTLYSANSSCTVNVAFAPSFSGARHGALILSDNSGNLIQTIYFSGTGVGSQGAFQPAASSTAFVESSTSCAQFVDGSGDIYVSLSTNGICSPITKWTPSNGSYTQTTIPSSSLSRKIDIAVDGAGNVYIADTNNGRVLKETLLNGTYSESVIATGLSIPRLVNVDGNGEVYFVVGIYNGYTAPSFYEEIPAPSGGYTQTVLGMSPFQNPVRMAIDDQGDIYVEDDADYGYFVFKWDRGDWEDVAADGYKPASNMFLDANGNLYVSWDPSTSYKYVHSRNESEGWTAFPMPIEGWGMDGSGNLYQTVDNAVNIVHFANPPSLRFAQTVVGSKSTDSPKTATLENIGNAPLIFSVPSSGTNPSVSTDFALDSSSTCPQVGVGGAPLSLAMDASCTYAVNFTPATTGTIDGSVIASDNALNAVGGTQTIPLSGSGASGIGGNAVLAVLTIGPGGVPQGVVTPNQSAAGLSNSAQVWVDTTHRTMVDGYTWLVVDQNGNATCTLASQANIAANPSPKFGTLNYTTEEYHIPGCGDTLYPVRVARYTWGPYTSEEQDPFQLQITEVSGTESTSYAYVATLSPIRVGPAFPGTSAPNSSLTATATLVNPPAFAQGYDWQIIGGNGAVVFPNGEETMSSTTNSISVEWPNPTSSSIPYDVQVGVRYSGGTETYTAAESDPLLYGPTPDTFIDEFKDNGKCGNRQGACIGGDPISFGTGNVFEEVDDYETAGQNKLSYVRYYNSLADPQTYATTLGKNWRSNYDRYLRFISSSFIIAERPDGQVIDFHPNGSDWVSDTDLDYVLMQSGTTWTLKDHDDTIETYTQLSSGEGQLQSIALRNGYTQTMTYDGNNHLSMVTDSYSRQLSFTYASGIISTVTTPDGLVLTYGYNSVQSLWDELASVSYSTSPVTSRHYLYQQASVPYALTAIADENGEIYESWTYDDQGRGLSNQVGGAANRITVSYDDTTMTRTVANALGVVDTYAFSILQNLPKVTQISRKATSTTAATSETFSYDENGYLSSETDWDGNETTYVNNGHGDPTSINEGVGSPMARTTTIAYDPTFVHLPDTITTPGLTTTFTYDGNGEVLTKTLTDTTTQSMPYSTSGSTREWQYAWQNSLLASVQSPRTDMVEKTSYTYDSTGALTAISNPLNQQTTITSHTGGGLPLTIEDPNGVTTTLTYDPRQHLLTSTTAGHETKYGYDAAENLTSVTQPDGSGLTYSYDAAHRLTGIKDLLGQSISYTLDALGDPTATNVLNASGTMTSQHSNVFDALGRMLKDIGAASQTSSFTYDAMGNMLTATDQASNKTQRAFDALNRLYKITDPASGITTTSYDAHDRPLSVTAPTGGATAYVYDGFGDLIQESSPNTGTTVYYYDSAGNRTKRVAATGAVTQYTYDALDRVLTMTFPADSAENVTYTYDQSGHGDGIGRLTSVTDAAGTLSRSYDQFGNLLTDVRTTSTTNLTTAYTYDAANRIASITYPSGAVVSYTRDTMGRVTAINAQPSGGASAPVVSNVTYEPFGPYSALTYGNGVAEARGFDQDYRLTGITDTGASALQNLSYAYYPTNNVHTITDAVNAGNSQSFSYDNLQRLTQATGGYGSFGFTYDKDGNRLTQALGGVTTTYGYGTANDLLQTLSVGGVQTQAIGYTADGRMATFSPGIQAPGGQYITALSYNQDAQLAAVNAAGGALASYTYDGFGQRVIKVAGSAGNLFQYGQDGMLLEETNASGAGQADYIYLDGRPVAVLNGSTLYYLHTNQLGTPQLATDSNQNAQWQASYDPFGQASVSGTITQNLRLPGQYFDVESGWNHNSFRDYAPQLGRYIEPDPLGRLGSGNNLYAYVYDNPTNLFDPLGLCPKCQAQPSGQTPPQYPNMWERAFDILSNGGFIYYGNWGGPGWTGGQLTPYEDLSPEDQQNLAPPIDAQDNCYRQHDMCYSRSRVDNNGTTATQKCQSPQQKRSEKDYQRSCDGQLMMCLRGINSSTHPGWGNQPSGYNIHSLIGEPTFSIKEMWP